MYKIMTNYVGHTCNRNNYGPFPGFLAEIISQWFEIMQWWVGKFQQIVNPQQIRY